jgi:hypothetical protein
MRWQPAELGEEDAMTDISPPQRQALGIGLEEFEYPYPVGFFPVTSDLQSLTMA